jgi:hypothetical protein
VNKSRLAYIQATATAPADAAVQLLIEVYKDEALKCCCIAGSESQPMLSSYGIEAILGEHFFKFVL